MLIDQTYAVIHFCLMMAGCFALSAFAKKRFREISKPRGHYANGLPERRRRPRLVLPDPANLSPRPVAPGMTI